MALRRLRMPSIACAIAGLLALGFATPRSVNAQLLYTGIRSQNFEYSYSQQHNSQWCWAASIQMILNYYGVAITQEQIVQRSFGSDPYGNLPDWGGSFDLITANLNNWSFDNNGRRYSVVAQLGGGAPPPQMLLDEVSRGFPVLIAYTSGPNSGHAVVATAASYQRLANGMMVTSIVVRDPWPSPQNLGNRGRVEYTAASLASVMSNYWIIRVRGF